MSSIALKISSLLIRTLSKPIANRIKAQAREHPQFRDVCVSIAQSLHRLDMRLRLGLLQDQAAIDRQIAREAAEALAKKQKAEIPTVKTEAQTKADEAAAAKDKEKITEKIKSSSKPRIRPLSEAKAIDSGATFISETFLFGVALSTILFESWRQRRKEASRRSDVADKLKELEDRDRAKSELLEALQHEVESLRTAGGGKPSHVGQSWFWSLGKGPVTEANHSPNSLLDSQAHITTTNPASQSRSNVAPPPDNADAASTKASLMSKPH